MDTVSSSRLSTPSPSSCAHIMALSPAERARTKGGKFRSFTRNLSEYVLFSVYCIFYSTMCCILILTHKSV